MLPCIIYMFIWTTIIYDPIACWTWNSAGAFSFYLLLLYLKANRD